MTSFRVTVFLVAAVWFNPAIMGVANCSPLSFASVYHLAQEAAPELALARYQVDSADSDRAVALGKILPQVSLFGQFSDNRIEYDSELAIADQSFYGQRYGLQVRQSLLNVADGLEITRLKYILKQSKEQLAVAEAETLNSLVEAYLNVLVVDADLKQFSAELDAIEMQLTEAEALYEKNLLPVTQVLETQTRADALRADVVKARGDKLIAREELSQLTGQEITDLLEVRENFTLMNRHASAADASREASKRNPLIYAAEAAVEAARASVSREKASRLPKVELTYSFQHSDVGFDNMQVPARDNSTLAVGFSYPLFEGGAGFARLRGATARFRGAETIYQAEVRKTEARARSAWLNLQAATERLIAAKRSIVSAKTNVDASKKAVLAGTARVSDVLIALSQNTRAIRDHSMAKVQYALGWVQLELATGADPTTIAETLSRAIHEN